MTHAETRKYWESVDWDCVNRVLAKKTGTSMATVCKWRRKLGKPKSWKGDKRKSKAFAKSRAKAQVPIREFKTTTDAELGRKYGLSRERIRQLRNAAGKPSSRTLSCADYSQVDWSMADGQIAEILGRTRNTVWGWRKTYELPKSFVHRIDYSKADWTQSYKDIAKSLGCSEKSVILKRKQLFPNKEWRKSK